MKEFSIQNIILEDGFALSLVGLSIVFTSLITISFFIYLLPKILNVLDPILPKATHLHHQTSTPKPKRDDSQTIAAIAYAIHQNHKENN
jgi:Na+-transporting methylmalonyl-CoA/oxaloacetate decarboxylase gamma subunit